MNNLSYTQEYFLCALNRRGTFAARQGMKISAYVLISGLMELTEQGYISKDRQNVLSASRPFEDKDSYLKPLYDAVACSGKRELAALLDMYVSAIRSYGGRRGSFKEIVIPIAKSLEKEGYLHIHQKKFLFVKMRRYIPRQGAIRRIIDGLEREFLQEKQITDKTFCLASLLDGAGLLSKYFNPQKVMSFKQIIDKEKQNSTRDSATKLMSYVDSVNGILKKLDWGAI